MHNDNHNAIIEIKGEIFNYGLITTFPTNADLLRPGPLSNHQSDLPFEYYPHQFA